MSTRGSTLVDTHTVADLLIVAVTLLAPVVAASGAAWPRAGLFALASIALWLSPAVRRFPHWVNACFVGFVLCGSLAFLPLAAVADFPWWRDLPGLGVKLPGTISAQPWLTLQAFLTLVAGAAWAWFLLGREWRLSRRLILELFALGAVAILVWWLAAAMTGRVLSTTKAHTAFGSFPNRNQSGNFIAISGIVFAGLALAGRMRRWRAWPVWLGAFAVAVAAAVACGSRAGVLLLGAGAVGWYLWMSRLLQLRSAALLLLNGALLFAAGLLAFGGGLLDRLNYVARSGGELALDFRLLLYRDALPLLREASWHGIGMSNFVGVFARYRAESFGDSRAIHPESDWVWFIAELGWLAPMFLAALLWFAFRQCRPFAGGTERTLRAAGLVAGLVFLVHSFIDVSGHRATLLPALLLLGLAANPIANNGSHSPALVRGVAALMTLAVAFQIFLISGAAGQPSSESIRAAKRAINTALDKGDWVAADTAATRALPGALLDWELHFGLGSARVMSGADTTPATSAFAVARYLEPNPRVAFDEGVAWLVRESDYVEGNRFIGPRPDLMAAAWSNVFRVPTTAARYHYGDMLSLAYRYQEIRPYLRSLAGNDPLRLSLFVQAATPGELPETIAALLAVSPDLAVVPDDRLRHVLGLWYEHGDRERLLREMPANPRWLRAGWVYLGDSFVAQEDYRRACDLGRAQSLAPDLPPPPADPLDRLRAVRAARPDDVAAGVVLYQKLAEQGQFDEALRVVTAVAKNPHAPAYVNWIEADLRERAGDLAGAWKAWRQVGLR